MPAYPWLFSQKIDRTQTAGKIKALRTIGVPYEIGYEEKAMEELDKQAEGIVTSLKSDGIEMSPDGDPLTSDTEIVALIAYLQRLGVDIKGEKTAAQ